MNTIVIFAIAAAILLLVLWLVWVIRLAMCKHRLKKRNCLLLERYEALETERRKTASYEDLIEMHDGLKVSDNEQNAMQFSAFRKLENLMRQTRIYRNQKVSREELSQMSRMETKDFELMFKLCSLFTSVNDWLDSFRISEAVGRLREMKESEKQARKNTKENPERQVVTDRDTRFAELATSLGFSEKKKFDKACRKQLGMPLGELWRIL